MLQLVTSIEGGLTEIKHLVSYHQATLLSNFAVCGYSNHPWNWLEGKDMTAFLDLLRYWEKYMAEFYSNKVKKSPNKETPISNSCGCSPHPSVRTWICLEYKKLKILPCNLAFSFILPKTGQWNYIYIQTKFYLQSTEDISELLKRHIVSAD